MDPDGGLSIRPDIRAIGVRHVHAERAARATVVPHSMIGRLAHHEGDLSPIRSRPGNIVLFACRLDSSDPGEQPFARRVRL